MAYHTGMTGLRPTFTPSRLNVGGYGVTVRERRNITPGAPWLEGTMVFQAIAQVYKGNGVSVLFRHPAHVDSDGSLCILPEPWAARHYRRAVMGGAGVYRLGLWAFLAASRTADAQGGAALGVNGSPALWAFRGAASRYTWEGLPPLPLYLDVTQGEGLSIRQVERRHGRAAADVYARSVMRVAVDIAQAAVQAQQEAVRQVMGALAQASCQYDIDVVTRCTGLNSSTLFEEVRASIHAALNVQAAALSDRRERRAFRRAARLVLRVLRRMVPRRAPPRPSAACLPRPLHAQPRPPAAPLAPPAL